MNHSLSERALNKLQKKMPFIFQKKFVPDIQAWSSKDLLNAYKSHKAAVRIFLRGSVYKITYTVVNTAIKKHYGYSIRLSFIR